MLTSMENIKKIVLVTVAIEICVIVILLLDERQQLLFRIQQIPVTFFAAESFLHLENVNLVESGKENSSLNLIYYGSNNVIANGFNNHFMFKKYSLYRNKSLVKRFPRLLGIGAAKCGTGALRRFLGYHPYISISKSAEIFFFNKKQHKNFNNVNFCASYLKEMDYSLPHQITFAQGLGSNNLYAPANIKLFDPTIQLVMILKDPIHRALSNYLHFYKKQYKNRNKTFMDAYFLPGQELKLKSHSLTPFLYDSLLEPWLNTFKRSQIHIVDGDLLIKNPYKEMAKLENFLKIPSYYKREHFVYNETKGYFCFSASKDDSYKCLKRTKGRSKKIDEPLAKSLERHLPIKVNSSQVIEIMQKFLKSHNEHLVQMTKQNFSWTTS